MNLLGSFMSLRQVYNEKVGILHEQIQSFVEFVRSLQGNKVGT